MEMLLQPLEMLLQPLQRRDVKETSPVSIGFWGCWVFLVWMPKCVIPGPSECLQDYGPCMGSPRTHVSHASYNGGEQWEDVGTRTLPRFVLCLMVRMSGFGKWNVPRMTCIHVYFGCVAIAWAWFLSIYIPLTLVTGLFAL